LTAGAILYRVELYAVMAGASVLAWYPIASQLPDTRPLLTWSTYLVTAGLLGGFILLSQRALIGHLHRSAQQAEAMRALATQQAEKLAKARDAALASANAKGHFLANVSHEIRTPLNGMLGLLQLIDAQKLGEPETGYLQSVEQSGHALLMIVNDLLDFSRIEAGGIRLESVPFDLVAIVEDVVTNYSSAAKAKNIEVLTEVDAGVPAELCGDPLRLRQVLSNLVSNAVKFTAQGEVIVGLRTLSRGASHAEIELRISDTGIGIAKSQRGRIFRPFSQADASTTREYGGSGLGLPIAKQLVELMGGSLQLRSIEGRGSTFFFSLRFELDQQLSEEERGFSGNLNGLQILLLEDRSRTRATRAEQLASWGMTVSETTSAEGAIQRLHASPRPDLSLIDLRSLGTDWRTRAAEIAKAASRSNCAVVAIGHGTSDIEGGEHWVRIEHPVRRSKLCKALLEALDRTPSTRARILSKPPSIVQGPSCKPAAVKNGMRILVAEDNEVNQRVIEAHLHALGYEVDIVGDGEEALEALGPRHRYAAVLMDGQMPKLDGYRTTTALRKREDETGQTRIPVIALTAHAMLGDRRTAIASGMDDYLSKPFTRKELQKILTRWAARPDVISSDIPPNALDTRVTSQLLELEEERPGFLAEVIESFFRSADKNVALIKTARLLDDLETVRLTAHMLKGSSEQLGARRFGSICRRLEEVESAYHADRLVMELDRALEGAREALTGLADRALDAAS
jgi:two-component system sensor histidine kinase/response regulator